MLTRQEMIQFDPSNKEHRAAVRAFLKRRAWSDSPIRFAQDPAFGSVADAVQAKLLTWYMDNEEAKSKKKPSQLRQRIENSKIIETAGTLPTSFQ